MRKICILAILCFMFSMFGERPILRYGDVNPITGKVLKGPQQVKEEQSKKLESSSQVVQTAPPLPPRDNPYRTPSTGGKPTVAKQTEQQKVVATENMQIAPPLPPRDNPYRTPSTGGKPTVAKQTEQDNLTTEVQTPPPLPPRDHPPIKPSRGRAAIAWQREQEKALAAKGTQTSSMLPPQKPPRKRATPAEALPERRPLALSPTEIGLEGQKGSEISKTGSPTRPFTGIDLEAQKKLLKKPIDIKPATPSSLQDRLVDQLKNVVPKGQSVDVEINSEEDDE